jgi:NAD(P)-dependent dehydrogenase (short-subunit alcohol dehydrogenase family)
MRWLHDIPLFNAMRWLRRYVEEHDHSDWADRLHIYGLDFRSLEHVTAFADHINTAYSRLDLLINNAAQTVRHRAGSFQHLLLGELQCGPAAPLRSCVKVLGQDPFAAPESSGTNAEVVSFPAERLSSPSSGAGMSPPTVSPVQWQWTSSSSAQLSQVPMLPHGSLSARDAQRVTASHTSGDAQEQLVGAPVTGALAEEVPLLDMLEVQMINQVAPFALMSSLKELMAGSTPLRNGNDNPHNHRFVINVTSSGGQFAASKDGTQVHINMAKAALNMLTRTCAVDWAKSGICVHSVDPGCDFRQRTLLDRVQGRRAEADSAQLQSSSSDRELHGADHEDEQARRTLEDAAIRVLDPVVSAIGALHVRGGALIVNFAPTAW